VDFHCFLLLQLKFSDSKD